MPSNTFPELRILAGALLVLSVAACGDRADTPAPAADAPAETAATPEPAAAAAPADFEINEAIPREKVLTGLEPAGEPVYVAADDAVVFTAKVSNWTGGALTGRGAKGVRLGVLHLAPSEAEPAGAIQVMGSERLPLVQDGESAVVTVKADAAPLLGLPLRLELFQQNVAWFGRGYGQPIIEVGPFQRCAGTTGPVCDADGTPLATE